MWVDGGNIEYGGRDLFTAHDCKQVHTERGVIDTYIVHKYSVCMAPHVQKLKTLCIHVFYDGK